MISSKARKLFAVAKIIKLLKVYSLFFKLFKLFKFYVGVDNNVALVSDVQQSDSVIDISILFQVLFPLGVYRILSRVPHAIQ